MAKKTLEQVITDGFSGSKVMSKFFTELSGDAYCGYITGMVLCQYPALGETPAAIYAKAKELFAKGLL